MTTRVHNKSTWMSGNEAIALGAYEAGVAVASGYPGTPSTEIMEYLSAYDTVYTEWAPNEKVGLEVAIGASFAGGRALATMKHVGLNVAADPLFTASYTGGKGDFTEGGVRVLCIVTWPGVIEPGQIVGDILHVSDLYTTFARLGGAMEYIPTDRVIDGVDQTSLFLNGDGYSRRDYVMIYVGPSLAGAVKGRFKRDWKNATPGLSKNEFYDLYTDPRERTGEMIEQFHIKSMFNHQRQRHELWMKKYPNRPDPTYGPAMTGIENERPETRKIYEGPVDPKKLPFDPKEVWEQDLPFTWSDL